MPSGKHQTELDIPIEHVWAFVSDMNKWAPLVPGYLEHQILHERQSTWKFKGEVGPVQKTVHLQIDITSWQAPKKVTFDLTGLSENLKGSGYFEAMAITRDKTKITSHLDVSAKGMMGPVINPVLKSFVPKTTRELTEAIAKEIMSREAVSAV
ncbi:SRPBCC family protein [Lentibacillus sp. L22]|uniref:CoxG family protein n=1 Tax=Lentibacillus TaxID=175304 RepID=UPI0022B0F45A|nr:SRPBCC family protein [Lentibacillus daqui]